MNSRQTCRPALFRLIAGTVILLCAVAPSSMAMADAERAGRLAPPELQSALYNVREGDTWTSIAFRFGVPVADIWDANGVSNPDLLAPGQRLFIPGAITRQTSRGEYKSLEEQNLLRVAAEADTLFASLQLINQREWPYYPSTELVFLPDSILHLPPPLSFAEAEDRQPREGNQPVAPPDSAPPPTTDFTDYSLPSLASSRIGVQGNFLLQSSGYKGLLDKASEMGATWVKQQVVWKIIEGDAKGSYREIELEVLDGFVNAANARGLNVLLSVVGAPDWARPTTVDTGPPINPQDLADFMAFLASRYGGKVQAYEVWNEPNLTIEWTDAEMTGADYVRYLAPSYAAIKAANPGAIVVSAGLAPASDTPISVDDRRYLREMYAAGLANYADVIGIHPYGAANSPDTSYFGDRGSAPSHNDHPSFFFWDNINDYRIIQGEYGDYNHNLWATEFGWPTANNTGIQAPDAFAYMTYINETQQAQYIARAFEIAQDQSYMGPMFIYIMQFGDDRSSTDPQWAFGIFRPNGEPRPAFELIRAAPKY